MIILDTTGDDDGHGSYGSHGSHGSRRPPPGVQFEDPREGVAGEVATARQPLNRTRPPDRAENRPAYAA